MTSGKLFLLLWIVLFKTSTLVSAQTHACAQRNSDKIQYIKNHGQWSGNFEYKASIGGGTVFLHTNAITFDMAHAEDLAKAHNAPDMAVRHHAWQIKFVDCNAVLPIGEKPFSHYCNYFLGSDPAAWKNKIYPVERVVYPNLWDGIDMIVYSSRGNFKYEFVLRPGADANDIRLQYDGMNPQLIHGELKYETHAGEFKEIQPYCFQNTTNQLTEVIAEYFLSENVVSFNFLNGYAVEKTLTIDPELVAATLVGISSGEAYGYCSTYGLNADIFLGSSPFQSNLPIQLGAYDITHNGMQDIGVSRFNPTGEYLLWCTYLGGTGNDFPSKLICTLADEVFILGVSKSDNFPTSSGCFDSSFWGLSDVIISKLSAEGNELQASTYFGGSGLDGLRGCLTYDGTAIGSLGYRGEIELDENGNVLVGISTMYLDYSQTTSYGFIFGNANFTVFCMSPDLSTLYWATQIGTTDHENVCDMEVLADGTIALCGSTNSNTLAVSNDAYQTAKAAGFDGWIGLFNPANGAFFRSTFFGTDGEDEIQFIDQDSEGNLWVCGMSSGSIPLVGDAYSVPGSFDFIAKFDLQLTTLELCSPIGSGLGTTGLFAPNAFLIDKCDRIYISGHGFWYPLKTLPITEDAAQNSGGFYLSVFASELSELLYASFFGGNHVDGGSSRYDQKGIVYQAVCSVLGGLFTAMDGAYDTDAYWLGAEAAVFKIDFESPSVVSSFTYEVQSSCLPYTIEFSNWSDSASYQWNFGAGNGWMASQDSTLSFTYNEAGNYLVQLAAFDINSCNVWDTMKVVVHVPDMAPSQLNIDWQYNEVDLCQVPQELLFINTTTGAEYFQWTMPDGTQYENSPAVDLEIPVAGIYTIQLLAHDSLCNYSDSLSLTLNAGPPVLAEIEITEGAEGCVPQNLIAQMITNTATEGTWYLDGVVLGNGAVINALISEAGTHTLSLIATGPYGCNLVDTTELEIFINPLPQVFFELPDTVCIKEETLLLSGTPPGGVFSGSGVMLNEWNLQQPGTGIHAVEYSYTDEYGCSNTAVDSTLIAICDGIEAAPVFGTFSVYPNPTNGEVLFSSQIPMQHILVWNTLGQLVYDLTLENSVHATMINLSFCAYGLYQFQVVLSETKAIRGTLEVFN